MKILSQPDTKSWKHNCKCGNCEAQLEASATDIRHTHSERDGVYPASDSYYVNCPVCHKQSFMVDSSIPKLIQTEIKKKKGGVYAML